MKEASLLLVLSAFVLSSSAFAEPKLLEDENTNNVVVPAVLSLPSDADAPVGTVVYHVGYGFKGKNTTASGWDSLSSGSGTPITSGASNAQRTEWAKVACNSASSITSQSTSGWVSGIGNIDGNGDCTLAFANTIFTSGTTPVCFSNRTDNLNTVVISKISPSAYNAATLRCYNSDGSGVASSCTVDIMCMGQKQ